MNTTQNNLTIYTNANQLPKLTDNQISILAKFRNPKKEFLVILNKELVSCPENLEIPEQYKTILDSALQSAAKKILKTWVSEFSYVPTEVSENLFSQENILDTANDAVQENLSKEEFEELWKTCETRKHYTSSEKYRTNAQYRKVFAKFEELILKLQGTKSKFEENELDTILVKIKEEDFNGEFGQYVAKRIQYFKNKPVKESATLDIL